MITPVSGASTTSSSSINTQIQPTALTEQNRRILTTAIALFGATSVDPEIMTALTNSGVLEELRFLQMEGMAELLWNLDLWVEEGPETEYQNRDLAKQDIRFFLAINRTGTMLDLGGYNLSTLPDIWDHPSFTERLTYLLLNGNQLQTLPESIEKLTKLTHLDLSDNLITTAPKSTENLTSLTHLTLSSNEEIQTILTTVDQWIEDGLEEERLSRTLAKKKIKTFLFHRTQTPLDLSSLGLSSLPDIWADPLIARRLTRLLLSHNALHDLPESIEHLKALTTLGAAFNPLRALPESLGNLESLRAASFHSDNLQTLPSSIRHLRTLQSLNIGHNFSLTSLPQEILQLPTDCLITLDGCGLSQQVLGRLEEECRRPEYTGPNFSFSMAYEEEDREIDTRTTNELLDRFYEIADKTRFSFPEEFTNNPFLKDWLSRISYMADCNDSEGEKQAVITNKVLHLLELAADPVQSTFHDLFFAVVENATRSCGDSMSLSILHLGIARQFALLEPNDLQGLATLLLKGTWALSQMEEFARNKVRSLPLFDEIEVYLAYPIRLKKRLELPIDVDEMLYFHCSSLTEEDLRIAEETIRHNLSNEKKMCEFLISQEIWITALEHLGHLEEAQRNRETSLSASAEDTDFVSIQEAYQTELKNITSRILKNLNIIQADNQPTKKQRTS